MQDTMVYRVRASLFNSIDVEASVHQNGITNETLPGQARALISEWIALHSVSITRHMHAQAI